ncbi:Monosaccharide importer [Mycena indigotica]|uniref:Monosaccharide importer n=1 Tax=Mycena indigotica TaxID=2126181 RepID=A0A8H6TGX2_9AGAR|nr:Monosaccharide importer [Mycena indigotica]KAF7316512.1 Monosaccharide importer [Mycena indigotica]
MAGGPGGTSEGLATASLLWAIVMSAFAAFGGILFGYDTGTIGGIIVMKDWIETFGTYDPSGVLGTDTQGRFLKTANKSLVVSILSAGTFVGALFAYPMGDIVGRKWGIVASCCVFSLGIGLQLDTQWATFVVGRFIAGLGVGLVSCLVPMYQSECAPKSLRGLIVGLYQLAITLGALISAIVLNATKDFGDHSAWRIPIAVQFVWAFVLGGGMLLLPESPRYLLYKGRVNAARKALSRFTKTPPNSPEVDAQTQEIQQALAAEQENANASWFEADCFRNTESKNGLRTWTGIWLQAWQQLTGKPQGFISPDHFAHTLEGINFIMYYGTSFFSNSGIKNSFIITIIIDVVNTAMTIVGIQLIDRVGRRRLLLIGAAGMLVCEYIIAIVGTTVGQAGAGGINLAAQRVLIAFACFYIAFFACSWGPVAWVVSGEIFSLKLRAKSMSLAIASNWLWNFGIGYATPYLVDQSTKGQPNGVATASLGVKVFFIWGSTCVGCLLFAYFFIPETKGLSLEQIDLLYRNSSVLGSTRYRKEMLLDSETEAAKGNTEHVEDASDATISDPGLREKGKV